MGNEEERGERRERVERIAEVDDLALQEIDQQLPVLMEVVDGAIALAQRDYVGANKSREQVEVRLARLQEHSDNALETEDTLDAVVQLQERVVHVVHAVILLEKGKEEQLVQIESRDGN